MIKNHNTTTSLAEEMKSILMSTRALKKFAKELSLDEMIDIQNKFRAVSDELVEKKNKEEKERLLKENKIAYYIDMMKQDDIDISMLIVDRSSNHKQRKSKPSRVQYKFYDNEGKERTWTGRGRKPLLLVALLEQGHSLEEFKVS